LFTSKKQSNTNSNALYYSENLTRQSITADTSKTP
jgi:hypothetical protein